MYTSSTRASSKVLLGGLQVSNLHLRSLRPPDNIRYLSLPPFRVPHPPLLFNSSRFLPFTSPPVFGIPPHACAIKPVRFRPFPFPSLNCPVPSPRHPSHQPFSTVSRLLHRCLSSGPEFPPQPPPSSRIISSIQDISTCSVFLKKSLICLPVPSLAFCALPATSRVFQPLPDLINLLTYRACFVLFLLSFL